MAKERNDEPEEQERPIQPKKKMNLKWIIIMLSAVMVLGAGAATGLYFFMQKDVKKPEVSQPVVLSIWPMDAFIVNIADTNGERYLKLVIQLEVSDKSVITEHGRDNGKKLRSCLQQRNVCPNRGADKHGDCYRESTFDPEGNRGFA